MAKISSTDLDVFAVALGGNVFGWTADEVESFAVLDGYVAGGGNFIDTADMYSAWAPGNSGGESEKIIGRWLSSRNRRADIGAFDSLVRAGKVRYIAASNYTAPRLAQALATSAREGFARFVALQQHYNLMERDEYEGELAGVVKKEGLSSLPYFALAKGFLTGKYRPNSKVESAREESASAYLTEKGLKVLAALDEVAAEQNAAIASIALAWLAAQPTVVAPIASARRVSQLGAIMRSAEIHLTGAQIQKLSDASA